MVIEILESAEPNSGLLPLCRRIHDQGYTIALDDFVSPGASHCSPRRWKAMKNSGGRARPDTITSRATFCAAQCNSAPACAGHPARLFSSAGRIGKAGSGFQALGNSYPRRRRADLQVAPLRELGVVRPPRRNSVRRARVDAGRGGNSLHCAGQVLRAPDPTGRHCAAK